MKQSKCSNTVYNSPPIGSPLQISALPGTIFQPMVILRQPILVKHLQHLPKPIG